VVLSNFDISGGSEGIFDYVYFSGQMSVHYGDVKISRSRFSDSSSDDGLNIKYSNVAIDNSRFINNIGDQLDCDFCTGQLNENYFSGSEKVKSSIEGTDGLDLSSSKVAISKNVFLNFTDKAISIGEFSEVKVINNSISYSNLGIAVKDGSIATLIENKFSNNQLDVEEYIKKKMYPLPKIFYE
jgi:parallel beta-helix repeat protein